ncbi:terminase large subunit [Mycobacteroides abscessus]|uniref:terminase large subunit domain-containing protein n=1 Tax=Mycobacteroides abscessus TaxID=36809 RepID=UPI000C259A29|nr:terminase large subunit [Mycobacteroides abscessus]AWG51485.1 terminase large subunit [Mycobacteroides abscessus]
MALSAKAGPKAQVTAPPLTFKNWPRDRAKRRIKFIETYLKIPHGAQETRKFRLQPFQSEIIRGSFAADVRTALISIPRGNGKTMLAAALALAEMFVGPRSAEVLCVASNADQAGHVLKYARQMLALSPELAERVHVYADRLYLPENDATLLPLPAEPGALHGYNPSLLIVDELHVVTEDVWEAATSVDGKRAEQLTLAISAPASSPDSVMWRLVQHGRAGDDPAFFFREWSAPDGCAKDDPEAWRIANPALTCPQPFLAEAGLMARCRSLREPVFRQLRLGQWVTGVDAWLPFGAWDACRGDREVRPGERVVLAFDGSASGDSTALVGCTMDGHLWIEGIWENPGDSRWRVPRADVSNAVDLAFARYDVVTLAADPWGWRSEIEAWADKHGAHRVIEWNTAHAARMAPATDRLYQAVMTKAVSHNGDERLASHMAHCVAKATPMGDLVGKDKKRNGSGNKIDAAVAAIAAYDCAASAAKNNDQQGVWFF